jgi:CubicO group peptidase (beta-lactamase class C family)
MDGGASASLRFQDECFKIFKANAHHRLREPILAKTGHPTILSGLKMAMFYPMMTDPGTRWGYGPGIDWLGLMVEKIDGRRIDQFCREEIFEPLGMADTAFEVSDAMAKRLAAVKIRGEDGTFGPFEIAPPSKPEVYGMGHALYSTAPDYTSNFYACTSTAAP